jgi:hypothetical protein
VNTPLGPWLDYIADEPVLSTAFYAQLTTGDWLEDVETTVGVRWDKLSVDYKEVYTAGQPKGCRSLVDKRRNGFKKFVG